MRFFSFLLFFTFAFTSLSGQNAVTWATDVAPILYDQCAKCHRDGGLGHFSLLTYSDAFANRFKIQGATESKYMPPWMPDPTYRRYAHENRLTDAQISTIEAWVNAGAPMGDLSKAPPVPMFNNQSEVGVPDHVLRTPLFTVQATDDEYRCFVIPSQLMQTMYMRGLEAIPGNHEVVHHILIYEDVSGQARQLDQQTPEPGYVSFGGPGFNGSRLVGAWVPGSRTNLTPANMGVKLTAGADLVVQMHYPKGSRGKSDQTTLNMFFTPSNQGIREISISPIINHTAFSLQNGPLSIPPNTVKTYYARFRIPGNASVLTVAPHMHLIGRKIHSFVTTPQGDTIKLIRINDWNFHWQGGYTFQKVQKIPTGSIIHAYAEYDNTLDNPHQPSDPPRLVTVGEATTDEMMLIYFSYMTYQPGDENIVLDSTLLQSTSVLDVPENRQIASARTFPNPAKTMVTIEYELAEKTDVRVVITDISGKIVKTTADKREQAPGIYREITDLSDFPAGTYLAEIHTNTGPPVTIRMVKE
jgi:Secretion system C-terminal sorting domain/Copper type II ascorbate-dependent monooxygenase, C-terminal domain